MLSEPSLWLSKHKNVFAEEYHTLSSGLYWSISIGRPINLIAYKIMAPITCSMSANPGRRELAVYARCIESMLNVCDVGLQMPVEAGDDIITTVGHNISEIHDDGSMTLVPCESD